MKEDQAINQHALDLLNGGLDGELSAAEQEERLDLLAKSGDAREFNEELESFALLMKGLGGLDPPQYLQESIERQIRLPAESKVTEPQQGFPGSWFSANWLRTGFALAAVVVLTVGVYEMGSEPITELDVTNLVGTVIKSQLPDRGELVDQIRISNDILSGLVELRQTDNLLTLDVQLSSDGPTEVVVNFAGRGLDFAGTTRMQDRNDAVTVVDGFIKIVSSGEQGYRLKLRRNENTQEPQTAPLELEFFANNKLVHQARLNIVRH